MQSSNVNQNQNASTVGNQNQQDKSRPGFEISQLMSGLRYLELQLEDIRNNDQALQKNLQAGTEGDKKNSNGVGSQNKLNEVLKSYYENKIADIQQTLSSYIGGSAISSGGSIASSHTVGSVNGGQANDTMSGFANQGLNSMKDFFGNAANTVGNAVKDGLSGFGNMLGKASEWFVSQIRGASNPNEDGGKNNGNCTFASDVMLARYFGVMGGGAGKADSQIERMRGLSGASMDESEGATLSTAAKGLQKLGLNANVGESNISGLMNGLSQGKKYMLAVNPEKYEEFLGKDLTTSSHAVVLMGIRNGMALLFDPGSNKPITVSVGALQNAMGDMGNEVMEVSKSKQNA